MNFDSISNRTRCPLRAATLIVLMLLAFIAIPARAQFNAFEESRTFVLLAPTILTVADAPRTSLQFDAHGYDGIATIDFVCVTNTVGGTLTAAIQDSDNGTNSSDWASIANIAYTTSATLVGSNLYVTSLTTTNIYLLPGTVVTPTASTAGFASPYLLGAQYTNTISALSITPNAFYELGFNIARTRRYLRVVLTTGGTVTNITVGVIGHARQKQPRLF